MKFLLLLLLLIPWTLLGSSSCRPPDSMEFDLFAPRPYPDQPVTRHYTIVLDGEPYGFVLHQGEFATGLHPSQNVKLCWSSCGTTTRDPALCPAEVPPVETPCLLGCASSNENLECFPPTWFAVDGSRGGQYGRGGPRHDAVTGASRGWR